MDKSGFWELFQNPWEVHLNRVPKLGLTASGAPYIRPDYLRQVNLDKLRLRLYGLGHENTRFNPDFLHQLEKRGFKKRPTFQGPFDAQFIFKQDRISLWFAWGSRFHKGELILQLNPSYLLSFGDLLALLDTAVNNFSPSKTKILETDISLDLLADIRDLRQNLHIAGYRRLEGRFSKSKTLSLYFGAQEQVRVYDKGDEMGLKRNVITRIELHLAGLKTPCKAFTDLKNLPGQSLFKKIAFKKISFPKNLKGVLKDFEVLYRLHGYETAKNTLGGHRNFHRDVERRLILGETYSPVSCVQKGLLDFFNSNSLWGG